MGMIKDPTSWRVGFELGLAGFSFPYSKPRKPTAYLYNGVRLPALPEWDREVYPFAFVTWINSSSSATAFLYCSTVPIYKNDETSLFAYVIAKENGSMICYACSTWPDGELYEDWHRFEDGDETVTAETKFTVLQTAAIKWTNFDMLNYSDDSVYLAGSNPVPVYK